jgi:hypothetical protein
MSQSPDDREGIRLEANLAAQRGEFARVIELLRAIDPLCLTDSDKRLIELAEIHLRSA